MKKKTTINLQTEFVIICLVFCGKRAKENKSSGRIVEMVREKNERGYFIESVSSKTKWNRRECEIIEGRQGPIEADCKNA